MSVFHIYLKHQGPTYFNINKITGLKKDVFHLGGVVVTNRKDKGEKNEQEIHKRT